MMENDYSRDVVIEMAHRILEPSGQLFTDAYPNDAPDVRVLWQRPTPSLKAVETSERIQGGAQAAATASNR